MKSILIFCAAAMAAVTFSSCGGSCSCNSYNKDYLRDVPVHRTSGF